ncbi:MAG: hypothetical protein HFE86_06365 [Clostridiales bacterium]|nr:hypothetical protein [Clostridiales bacterium]
MKYDEKERLSLKICDAENKDKAGLHRQRDAFLMTQRTKPLQTVGDGFEYAANFSAPNREKQTARRAEKQDRYRLKRGYAKQNRAPMRCAICLRRLAAVKAIQKRSPEALR